VSADDSDPPDKDPTSAVHESSDSSPTYPVDPPLDPDNPPIGWRQRVPELTLGSAATPADAHDYSASEYEEEPSRTPTWRRGGRFSGSTAVHPVTGQTLRAWLTICLTLAVITVVLMGIIMRLPPGEYAQYISPLTGIAGLALGYWFGSEKND